MSGVSTTMLRTAVDSVAKCTRSIPGRFNQLILMVFIATCDCHISSMKKPDHKHSERVWFHDLGIWGYDVINDEGWELKSLSSIKRMLGHEEVQPNSSCNPRLEAQLIQLKYVRF